MTPKPTIPTTVEHQIHHRVRGRGALVRRLGALLLAVHRYGRCRAATDDEKRWAARVLDALQLTLDAADVTRQSDGHYGRAPIK